MLWIAVIVGAAFGACGRFAIDRSLIARYGTRWPYGTFVVNSLGSLILGLVTGALAAVAGTQDDAWLVFSALVGTGFCGAFTTFSGWAGQVTELSYRPDRWRGPAYALASLVVGLTLASIGYVIGLAIG